MPVIPELSEHLRAAVADGVFPGGVLWVQRDGRLLHESACGRTALEPPGTAVTPDTIFDLASLTKILATASLSMSAVARGELALDDEAARHLPSLRSAAWAGVTVRRLLEHSAGLVAWRPYYEELAAAGPDFLATTRGRDALRAMVAAERPEGPGRRALYSDLGFILLAWLLERCGGRSFEELFARRLARSLERGGLFFIDLTRPARARAARRARVFAATERCPWRGRTLVGEVHDDNAYAMGGVSGHAGLFGTAAGCGALAAAWLSAWQGERGLFEPQVMRTFWQRSAVPGSERALGFDTPAVVESQAGSRLGPLTVGHLGFTGTSLWLDPERRLIVVLLTNRVHPRRDNQAITGFRPRLHDLLVERTDRAGG